MAKEIFTKLNIVAAQELERAIAKEIEEEKDKNLKELLDGPENITDNS